MSDEELARLMKANGGRREWKRDDFLSTGLCWVTTDGEMTAVYEPKEHVLFVNAKEGIERGAAGDGSAAATKTPQENEVHYGSLTLLRFSFSVGPEQLANGNYSATLFYGGSNTGGEGSLYVEFPPPGLNFIKSCLPAYMNPGPNSHAVYGRPYTAPLQNGYGAQSTATAYWLVGVNVNTYSGNASW